MIAVPILCVLAMLAGAFFGMVVPILALALYVVLRVVLRALDDAEQRLCDTQQQRRMHRLYPQADANNN